MIQNFNKYMYYTNERISLERIKEGKRREGKKRVRSPGETLCKILNRVLGGSLNLNTFGDPQGSLKIFAKIFNKILIRILKDPQRSFKDFCRGVQLTESKASMQMNYIRWRGVLIMNRYL